MFENLPNLVQKTNDMFNDNGFKLLSEGVLSVPASRVY